MVLFLQKLLVYGCLGLLLEVFFTGFHSLITGNRRALCQTYLWMFPIYALAACSMEQLHNWLRWGIWLNALIYVPLIYLFEFVSGFILKKTLGRCPWDYGVVKYGIMGLIRFDYAPIWFIVALFFDYICGWIDTALGVVSKIA